MKKLIKVTVITLLVIIAILFTLPLVFKGKIVSIVKTQINKHVNARVDFDDVNISLLRRFPKVSVALEKLQVTGTGKFAEDTLISADGVDVALNLISVIKGSTMKIYSVTVNRPRIHAIVAKDGKANWDIMKPDTSSTPAGEQKPFNMELQQYSINDGYVYYMDSAAGMRSEIIGLQHKGRGDFTADHFTLSTSTSADAVNFTYGPIPYLVNTKTKINADIDVDNTTSKYTFKTDEIALNELKIAADGFFQIMKDSSYNMDIKFNAPSTDFKNILSLIPVVYQKDFAKVKTGGKAIFNGSVKGIMNNKRIPAYHVNLNVADAFFQYPDLPAPVRDINVAMKVDNPDGVTDHTVVDISRAHFAMDKEPFDFRLLLKTPVSDMWVDAQAKGRLDLTQLGKMVKLQQGTNIKGLLNADVSLKGFIDAVQKQQFDKFTAAGTIALKGFSYQAKDYPDGVVLNDLLMTFNPRNVTLNNAEGKYLNTNFQANGAVNNLIGYALKNRPLEGALNMKADHINVNDWMGTDTASNKNKTSTAFIVPANLDLVVNALAGTVKYDNLLLENVSGSLRVADEVIRLQDVKGNALDGTINISGSYSTKVNKKKPVIALQYNVENLDVQKTFNTFNTVQKLMPIGKYLGGKINSKLNLTGSLGSNMMPDLTSLTGDGTLFVIQGLLEKFKPLESLADKLNVNELKNISLREIREEFEFNAGKVFVKPFNVKVNNIDMEIGGMHGFDQSLDYTIQMKIPRSIIGAKGNQALNNLISQATSKGVPLKVSDVVNVHVKMLGTITKPDIRLDLKQTAASVADELKDQAKDFVKARVDSTRKTVTDTLQSLKQEALKQATEQLKDQLFRGRDSVGDTSKNKPSNPLDRLKESGQGLIENVNPFRKKK